MVIPESQRGDVREKIHQAHQGGEKYQLRTRSSLYWPNINKNAEVRVQKCEICQESQNAQANLRRPWNPTKYTLDCGRLLELICFHGTESLYLCSITVLSLARLRDLSGWFD